MSENVNDIVSTRLVENEIKDAYLEYAMSVIVGRALPDVRDGLKPVHRRSLFTMHEMSNVWNKPYKKSARIVGGVLGKYHPHGDTAIYDAIVRMAQNFSMRYRLVDGHGNFGSIDGDSPAAMRYTEIRLQKLSGKLLEDIECQTVNFVPNFDNTEHEPTVLPARFPNVLINGSSGIAVGMATNIPPHNLSEVIDGTITLIDNPEATLPDVMEHIKGPDFPTAGFINGTEGILSAYQTGRGKIQLSAKIDIEESKNKEIIVVSELPFQVNKAKLLTHIGQLVRDKKIEGIHTLRDESDRHGMRIAIEVKRGENAEVLKNNLLKQTMLQTSFGINMVCLDHGVPKCMPLIDILKAFIAHRQEVVTRRTVFLLAKARSKAHVLEGLAVAISHLDEVIELIKKARNPSEAKSKLLSMAWNIDESQTVFSYLKLTRPDDLDDLYGLRSGKYYFSPQQAQAILDLRLHRLTGLERDKIINDHAECVEQIKDYIDILSRFERLMNVIKDELLEVKNQFSDERQSVIIADYQELSNEDLIPKQEVVVTITKEGYAKAQPVENYKAQRRGGRGKSSGNFKEEDIIRFLRTASSHDTMLCFTNKGRVFWLKVYQLPISSRASRGKPLVNYLKFTSDETLSALLPLKSLDEDSSIIMATEKGVIKKTSLSAFSRPRSTGMNAINLDEEDKLISAEIVTEDNQIMLFTNHGKVNRFDNKELRSIGRNARGVRGIKLGVGHKVISMVIVKGDEEILTVSEKGFGKKTKLQYFRQTSRGGSGVIAMRTTDKVGLVIGALPVTSEDELLLLTNAGTMIRILSKDVSLIQRQTQGVKLINVSEDEKLVAVQSIEKIDGIDIDDEYDQLDEEN